MNLYDVVLCLGEMKEIWILKFFYVLGNDGVGIVIEIGLDVIIVYVGDWVVVYVVGGIYGEEVVLLLIKVVKILDEMRWEEVVGMVILGIMVYNLINYLMEI